MTGQDGAMAIAMSALVAIAAVLAVAVASLGILYGARAQATNAADAAALAAAVATYPQASPHTPLAAARSAAGANGASVLSCRCPRDGSLEARTVKVTAAIAVDVPIFGSVTVTVSSRAEFDPRLWLGR
jgi:Flp pilus assembly protein TadG